MSKDLENIIIPEWPLHSFIKSSYTYWKNDLKKLEQIQTVREKHLRLFNKFKGEFLNKIIDIENCIDVLFLEILSRSDNNLKKEILYCFYTGRNGISFSEKAKNLHWLIKGKNEIFTELSLEINAMNNLLINAIQFRNIIAHEYVVEEYSENEKGIGFNTKTYKKKLTFNLKRKREIFNQLELIQIYLEFIRFHIGMSKNTLNATMFLFIIGRETRKYKPKFSVNEMEKIKESSMQFFKNNYGFNLAEGTNTEQNRKKKTKKKIKRHENKKSRNFSA